MLRPAPYRPALSWLLLALVLSAFSVSDAWAQTSTSAAPAVGDETSQTIELEAGPNLVALYVRPDDPDIEALFEDVLDQIVLVKDSEGVTFAPGYGVRDLTEWEWTEAYLVYARGPVSVEVWGRQIEGAAVALGAGWDWVPYLGAEAAGVEEAFASLDGTLTRVEGADGRMYPARRSAPPLETLEPGRGYRVHLTKADTLAFGRPVETEAPPTQEPSPTPAPAPPAPAPAPSEPPNVTVASIAEALALRGLASGQVVEVEGYYGPGDGGGGTFDVVDSGATPDGGTVFVPDAHVSGPVVETRRYSSTGSVPLPEGQSAVYGTLTVDVLSSDGEHRITLPGEHFHGHVWTLKHDLAPAFDYGTGRLRIRRSSIQSEYGSNARLRFTYRTTTSGLRLVRRDVGTALYAEWFGARPAAEGPNWTGSTDTQPILAHALTTAHVRNKAALGSITEVRFSRTGTFTSWGNLTVPDGVTLRGAGGTEVVEVTNDLGHTYRPVRYKAAHTRLRVPDDEAFRFPQQRRPKGDPGRLPPTPKSVLYTQPTQVWVADGAMTAGLADIVLDGNWEGNTGFFTDPRTTDREKKDWGQDSPSHAGFVATSHGGVDVPQGQRITVRNVGIDGFISNGLLGHVNGTWDVENVRLGNGLWNHVIYNANGSYRNVTLHGAAWGHTAWGYGTIENLVFEDGMDNPIRRASEAFAIRGGDAFDEADLQGGYWIRSDGTPPPHVGTTITGFYVDLRGSGLTSPFWGIGSNVTIRGVSASEPGRIIAGEAGMNSVYTEAANGYQRGLYDNNRFEHIVVYDHPAKNRGKLFGTLNVTNSVVRDVRTDQSTQGPPKEVNHVLRFGVRHRGREAWDARQTMTYEDVHETAESHFVASARIYEDGVGADVHVRRSSFNNKSNAIIKGPSGGGSLDQFGDTDVTKLRVFWDDVTLNLHGGYFGNTELWLATGYFHDVTDRKTGNTSEDSGRYTRTARGGETTVDIPTRLLWAPQEPGAVSVRASASGLVRSVEAVQSSSKSGDWRAPTLRVQLSRALRAGERVTFDWSAAVRPFPGAFSSAN